MKQPRKRTIPAERANLTLHDKVPAICMVCQQEKSDYIYAIIEYRETMFWFFVCIDCASKANFGVKKNDSPDV